ncbi:MAG: ABC transporter permease [Kofleriaceae bacterium]
MSTGAPPRGPDGAERRPDAGSIVPPRWHRLLRAEPPGLVATLLGVGTIVLVLVLWFLLTLGDPTDRVISPSKLPSPGETFGALGALFERGVGEALADTLQRVFLGIAIAAIVGIVAGVLAAAHRGVAAAVLPLVIFLRSVPMGALIPLTLLLFGTEEKQKVMFIFLAVVPFVFSDSFKAVSIIPDRYVETAQTLGASKWQIVYKVLVPLAIPDIVTSLRFQLGLALGYITLAEAIDAPHGLGKLISLSERLGKPEQVYLLLFMIALLAFSLDYLLRIIQRGAFPWRRDL